MSEWFTAQELADMNVDPNRTSKRAWNNLAVEQNWRLRRNRAGNPLAKRKGAGWIYHYSLLPAEAQARIMIGLAPKKAKQAAIKDDQSTADLWAFYESLTDARKSKTQARLEVLEAVHVLQRGGLKKNLAISTVAHQYDVTPSTIYNWFNLVAGVQRADWLPALAPRHAGRTKTADCSPDAWELVKSDYLRAERPTFESCYRRLESAALAHGWSVPSSRSLERRIEREIAVPVRVLARRGVDALKAMYPAQERDRSGFHALEAVNADGHKWDVWVQWPDEDKPMRPMMVAVQDLYSGLFLGWRIDKSENKEAVRLTIGDVVEDYGIPGHIYLDNGRGFAAKWLTGGIANRFRFKIKEEEPVGILTQLGVEVHWTLPYSGQSKPIERAFKDFCNDIAKHPAFAGAWTGNTPLNKPENYGAKAVPIDDFIRIVGEGIAEHNQRVGRRAAVCHGRSFAQTFAESYAQAPIKKATDEQRRLWLLAAEGVMAARRDGAIKLMGNRYWADFLHGHMGQKLVVRFDPDHLHSGLHVYRLDGSYLGFAEVIDAAGFSDAAAARDHGRTRKAFMKGTKALLDQHRTLTGHDIAAQLPTPQNLPPATSKVVRMASNDDPLMTRPAVKAAALSEQQASAHQRVIERLDDHRVPDPENTPESRYARARDLEDGSAVTDPDERMWLERYQATAEYKSRRRMEESFKNRA